MDIDEVIDLTVFDRHGDRAFDKEWGYGGVTISCGPRFWVVHIPCDPDFTGKCEGYGWNATKCKRCGAMVPDWVNEKVSVIRVLRKKQRRDKLVEELNQWKKDTEHGRT